MAEHSDFIVLGLGGVGSAAVLELARRGLNVRGLEQFAPAHDRGSSHGESRIIRKAYFEHPDYVPLLHKAYESWRNLESASRRRLFDEIGLLLCGPETGEAIAGTLRAAARHQLPLDLLTSDAAAERYPLFRYPRPSAVLCEHNAGRLHVEACVAAQLELARCAGAKLHFQEQVTEWSAGARDVRVSTDRGHCAARALIVTAGAWAPRLLAGIGVTMQVLRKVQLWFPCSESARFPAFYFEEPEGSFYGLPTPMGGQLKVAEHSGGESVDDPRLVDRQLRPDDLGRVQAFVDRRLQGVTSKPVRHSVCLYTMSPDGHFLLDRHPRHDNVWFAAGLSGHGFKFAGVLGQALADLAVEGQTDLPVKFLRLARFATAAK